MPRTLLPTVLLLTLAAAPLQGQEADPAPPEASIAVRPTNASLQRSVQFDEQGTPQNRNANLSIAFIAEVETDLDVLSVDATAIESITSSLGVPLSLRDDRNRARNTQPLQRRNGEDGPGSVSFQVNLPEPPDLRGVGRARGTLVLTVADGPARELRFVPIDRYLGRTATVEDMDDAAVETVREGNGRVRFTVPDGFSARVGRVGYAAAGKPAAFERDPARMSNRGNGTSSLWIDAASIPAGGGVVFRVYPSVREVSLPWECGPFDLPSAEAAGGLRLAMRTVAEGEAPEAAGKDQAEIEGKAEAEDTPLPLRIDGEIQPDDRG